MDIDLVSTEKKGWRFDISDMEFWRQPAAHSGDFLFIFYYIWKKNGRKLCKSEQKIFLVI